MFYLKSSLLSLSCSSDLCNYVDGADLAVISSATGKSNNSLILFSFIKMAVFFSGLSFDRFCLIVLPSILILLLWQ